MITVSHDYDGRIVGYIEWRQVGRSGFDKLYGEYVWVEKMWIHPEFKGTNVMYEMFEDVLIRAKEAQFAYFRRGKYNNRLSKLYKREQFENLIRKVEERWEVQPK